MSTTPVLALTVGDPVGIGPEITAKTLAEFAGTPEHHGIAVGDRIAMEKAVEVLGLDVEVRAVDGWDTPSAGEGVIDVFDIGVLGDEMPAWGVVDGTAGRAAITAIEVATQAAMEQKVSGIVTGPINKEAIWAAGSKHLGHTEMLGELTGVTKQDTMFVVRNDAHGGHHLRIFFATRHMSLRKALDAITIESQVDSIVRAYRALQVFGVPNPGSRPRRSTRTAARTAPSATRRSRSSGPRSRRSTLEGWPSPVRSPPTRSSTTASSAAMTGALAVPRPGAHRLEDL